MLIESPAVQFALQSVGAAIDLARLVQRQMVTPALTKADHSPVTIADYAVQALVTRRLQLAFPGAALIAEENAAALRTQPELAAQVAGFVSQFQPEADPAAICDWIDQGAGVPEGAFWTLDPIDGTKGFLRGDQYVTALALIEAGQVQLGVLGCPNLRSAYQPDFDGEGCLVFALRGQGAWLIDRAHPAAPLPLHVSTLEDPAQARLLRSFEAGHTNVDQVDQFAGLLGVTAAPVRMDSQAKYAVMAAGHGEILLRLLSPSRPDYKEMIWDQAAGALIVSEAGGQITDLDGQPLDFSAGRTLRRNRGVLATNRRLHPAALNGLRHIGV